MVKESRIVFGPSDIDRLRVVCKCGGEVVFPMHDNAIRLPRECPQCNDEWTSDFAGYASTTHAATEALSKSMRKLEKCEKDAPFSVLFELQDSVEKAE